MTVAGQEGTEDIEVVNSEGQPIEAPDPEGGEGGDAASGGDEPAERKPSRKERRQNEMRAANEAREAAERAVAAERQERERLAREVSRLSGYIESESQRRQGGDQGADVEARAKQIRRDARMHLERAAAYAKAGNQAAADAEWDAYDDKVEEAREMRRAPQRAAEIDAMVNERISQMRGNQAPPEVQAQAIQLATEFPQVRTDQNFRDLIDVKLAQLQRDRKPLNYENMRAAMADAARILGIGGRQAPTDQQRQRYQAPGQGESGGGGGAGPVRVPWNQEDKKFAQAMFPTLEGKELKTAYDRYMAEAKRRGEW